MVGKPMYGGTTISGTMILSELAGIKIFGTGGLGKSNDQYSIENLTYLTCFRWRASRRRKLNGYFW
jgi:Uncharacterized enzyme involved in pigment biosynthesis